MKVAIAFLTKDRLDLTKQTLDRFGFNLPFDIFWVDGSTDEAAIAYMDERSFSRGIFRHNNIRGGADAAIVFALTKMLEDGYEYVGLCENDVLLTYDWYAATMALFEKGAADGLAVGAVSARAYADRILIQRDDHAVMFNLGAGMAVYTRQAAELILANYRTGWWHDTRAIFAQVSGIDIGRYAAFRGNEQWTTADWHFDAVLVQHGLASLALTPAMVDMIGQEPSLEEQGLRLVQEGDYGERRDDLAFERFVARTASIRAGAWKPDAIQPHHRYGSIHTYFAHQLSFPEWEGEWRLKWSQGFGPFAWIASEDGCRLQLMLFGPVTFMVSGGKHGAKVSITDTESGYEIHPDLPIGEMNIAQLNVPAGTSYRQLVVTCGEGAVFYGVQTTEPQPITNHKFDYHSLPPV